MMKAELRPRLIILSASYLMLMSLVWIVALSVGEYVRPEHFLTHFLGFCVTIVILLVIVHRLAPTNYSIFTGLNIEKYAWVLVLTPVVLLATYVILLGNVPLIDAIRANEYYAVTRIRTDISKSGFPESYIPALVTRSIAPAIIVYFLHQNKFMTAFFVFLSAAAVGLLTITKGHVIFATFPVILYCALTKRFLQAGLFLVTAGAIIYAVMVVTNPAANAACKFSTNTSDPACQMIVEPLPDDIEGVEKAPAAERLARALVRRAFLVPGQVVAEWFEIFPAKVPFEQGCGYRFLAPIVGCKFEQNARLVYAIQYPDRVAQGIRGSKNAAHFMEEYANFGLPGLFLAGALAAMVISVATLLMSKVSRPAFLSINLIFILMMASTALHTTLLSGGWLMAMITSAFLIGGTGLSQLDLKSSPDPRSQPVTR
ncbi:hypothetical protein [Rhizobium sp. SL42]|uniref:hypothetical protein n=1 Tax=Rhizobium sp. SL42 TaxID=2806346 RepID=UPI001F42DDA1|nr:hypothetical protein [Rhizobium sp. SL42]UJW76421.1 hypothetical protein IM739_08075 [Rhizobium sp. SL42]